MTLPSFFWATEREWRQAHETLAYLFDRYGPVADPVRLFAGQARQGLEVLFPMFDRFAEAVCPDCDSICCLKARVDYNFTDLVFMHALGLTPPPRQIREREDQPCRYLSPAGCTLPRILRPFVCTWYFCAPMLELYRRLPPRTQRMRSALMREVQRNRNDMEAEFMRIVTGRDIQGLPYEVEA
ncbi:MAG: hypothetical protein KKB20_04970 [Proteobacteria bacterium]|nr:hypothetical protein [Pseudomonadota bacterium]